MAHEKFYISTELCEFLINSETQATRSYTEAEVREEKARKIEKEKLDKEKKEKEDKEKEDKEKKK